MGDYARNPDTLPDSLDPNGPCPRCGRIAAFTPAGNVDLDWDTQTNVLDASGGHQRRGIERVSGLYCNGCERGVAVVEEEWTGDAPSRDGMKTGGTITWRGIHWYPPPGSGAMDEAVSVIVQRAYDEAQRCMAARAFGASAVMLRRTIEAIVLDQGGPETLAALTRNLASGLAALGAEGKLQGSLVEWAREIRLVGNVGAHFDPLDEVSEADAISLDHLVRRLIEYVYEMPARIRRSRTQ